MGATATITELFEILDSKNSNAIIEDFYENFPIAFWNRIDWGNAIVNRVELNDQGIKSISYLLISKGFDTSIPIYIFWGYNDHPSVKTKLTGELLSKIEDIVWLRNDFIFTVLRKNML